MARYLPFIDLERYLRFFWAFFLSLICSLFLLEVIYLFSGTYPMHSFINHWFKGELFYHTGGIMGGFVFAGLLGGAWLNSRDKSDFLMQEIKSLKDTIEAKINFVSFVSHEIRSPVTGLRYSIKMLLDEKAGNLSSDQSSLLTKAYQAAEELNSLVSEFLDTSKIESEKLELVIRGVALNQLVVHIKNITEEFQPLLQSNKQTLDLQLPLDQTKAVAADAQRIFQVVRNLLQNAINYTPPGGKISIVLKTTPTDFDFTITDSGIGIPKKEQSKIFGKFYRALNARMAQGSGTGLGLYLCKKLVEGHQGNIWFTSEENKGATFTFSIPLKTGVEVEELFRKI